MATAQQMLNCSIDHWYSTFQTVSFRSQIVPLPADFVNYLVEDGVYLPDNTLALPKRAAPDLTATEDEYRDWSDEDDTVDCVISPDLAAAFPEVNTAVQEAITALGGTVIPKLNWSCPKDATWVTSSNSIKCSNADEVLLLLKSSDRAAHDICNAFDSCISRPQQDVSHVLVLKKFYDLKPEREFRCFIRCHDLIGACQRDVTQHFPAIQGEVNDIEECILEFFEEHIQHRFPDPDYTMDVYVTTKGKVRLVDFNPVGGFTAPLLFEWEDLGYGFCTNDPANSADHKEQYQHQQKNQSNAEKAAVPRTLPLNFRILTDPVAMRPNKSAYGMPYDLVDTSHGSAMSEMLQQLQGADTALADMHLVNQSSKPEE